MVFFGDPKTREEKDGAACAHIAIEMRERMKSMRRLWREQGIESPFRMRMDINTGYCTVGNFGSENRLGYTIIGSRVNLASRLKFFAESDQIQISHETRVLVADIIKCELKGEISVKGISKPVRTYRKVFAFP